jgi:hypothetical protein
VIRFELPAVAAHVLPAANQRKRGQWRWRRRIDRASAASDDDIVRAAHERLRVMLLAINTAGRDSVACCLISSRIAFSSVRIAPSSRCDSADGLDALSPAVL